MSVTNQMKCYHSLLTKAGFKPVQHSINDLAIDNKQQLQHCLFLLTEQIKNDSLGYDLDYSSTIGFVGGVLWAQSLLTLKQLEESGN